MKSYLSHVECTSCCAQYSPHQPMRTCLECGRVLFSRYDLAGVKRGVSIRETGGTAVAVTDGEMVEGMKEMASTEGIFPCPEGAATLVALKRLLAEGVVDPETTIVLLNTGSGLKYLELVE